MVIGDKNLPSILYKLIILLLLVLIYVEDTPQPQRSDYDVVSYREVQSLEDFYRSNTFGGCRFNSKGIQKVIRIEARVPKDPRYDGLRRRLCGPQPKRGSLIHTGETKTTGTRQVWKTDMNDLCPPDFRAKHRNDNYLIYFTVPG